MFLVHVGGTVCSFSQSVASAFYVGGEIVLLKERMSQEETKAVCPLISVPHHHQ